MLRELAIENLALFERASLAFGDGLNAVTGETGAGKSLLVGAVELLLGERARASVVRKGAAEARVDGRFAVASAALAGFLADHPGVLGEVAEGEEREIVLTRRVSQDGRSSAYVDHRPVTVKTLRELAARLVEIHGQNEHQSLLRPAEQLRLLDLFGGLAPLIGSYREARARWLALAEQRASFAARARERRDRIDLLRFQSGELERARLVDGEHAELERERELLRHGAQLATELGALVRAIADDEGSALDAVGRASSVLETWRAKVGAVAGAADLMQQARLHLEEASSELGRFLEGVEFSPERLEAVEARLYALEELERKYRTDAPGLLEQRRSIAAELAALEGEVESEDELASACEAARGEVEARAARLTRARRALRPKLVEAVLASLRELGLERASFDARIEPRAGEDALGPDGAEGVELLLCANPGEALQPLREVASGGETARIMLALRTALAAGQTIPTLIFDEIDAGVGGRLGPKVGEHLRRLAGSHQVLCVTHLPAIAALARHHFKVGKHVSAGRTRTRVTELEGRERVDEVADMIAGGAAHETARAEARRLLEQT